MITLDLLDRLLEHDAWTTRRVFEFAMTLSDEQLDQDFDVGHRTVRETARHMIGNVEVWTDLMAGRPVRKTPTEKQSMSELQQRFEAAFSDFAQVARGIRDDQRLNELYVDVLDQPPQQKSYAGTILHVITHDHMHRSEILHMLERLGIQGLVEGDVLSWEAAQIKQEGSMKDYPYVNHMNVYYAPLELVDVPALVAACTDRWYNQTLCQVNGSVVRLGVMQGEYHWHKHDQNDEFFFVLEGRFLIDLEGRTVELEPQQGFMVPKGVLHRTRAPERAVVLMVENVGIIPTGDVT